MVSSGPAQQALLSAGSDVANLRVQKALNKLHTKMEDFLLQYSRMLEKHDAGKTIRFHKVKLKSLLNSCFAFLVIVQFRFANTLICFFSYKLIQNQNVRTHKNEYV